MKLTVVGSAGSFGRPDSACSCYLLEYDGFRLLVDLGTGAVGALQAHVRLADVDAIVLTHLHADHCLDVAGWVVAHRYDPGGGRVAVPLHAPSGAEQRVAEVYGVPDDYTDVFAFDRLTAGTRQIGPFSLAAAVMAHPIECYGLRLEGGGRTLTYSADTGPCEALVELARDADMLLCEASFVTGRDRAEGVHLTGRQAGEHATEAGARRLLLTHLVAWNDDEQVLAEAQASYDGPLELARRGASYDV